MFFREPTFLFTFFPANRGGIAQEDNANFAWKHRLCLLVKQICDVFALHPKRRFHCLLEAGLQFLREVFLGQ